MVIKYYYIIIIIKIVFYNLKYIPKENIIDIKILHNINKAIVVLINISYLKNY